MPDWGGHPAPPIGGNDLDPLGRFGSGGMLMDPRAGRHRDIEPRWDPVGPMGPLAPARPNQGRKSFFLVYRKPILLSFNLIRLLESLKKIMISRIKLFITAS
jgi:hypothetical protein